MRLLKRIYWFLNPWHANKIIKLYIEKLAKQSCEDTKTALWLKHQWKPLKKRNLTFPFFSNLIKLKIHSSRRYNETITCVPHVESSITAKGILRSNEQRA